MPQEIPYRWLDKLILSKKNFRKRGACCIRKTRTVEQEDDNGGMMRIERKFWEVDLNIPVFKGEGREYIEKLLLPEEQAHLIYFGI